MIAKIRETQDPKLLQEAYRLLEVGIEPFDTFKLNDDQKNAISEAKEQIRTGEFLTDEEANKILTNGQKSEADKRYNGISI